MEGFHSPQGGLANVIDWLNLGFIDKGFEKNSQLELDFQMVPYRNYSGFMNSPTITAFTADALKKVMFTRQTKDSVGRENTVGKCVEEIVLIDPTTVEKAMHDSFYDNEEQQRKVCCSPQDAGYAPGSLRLAVDSLLGQLNNRLFSARRRLESQGNNLKWAKRQGRPHYVKKCEALIVEYKKQVAFFEDWVERTPQIGEDYKSYYEQQMVSGDTKQLQASNSPPKHLPRAALLNRANSKGFVGMQTITLQDEIEGKENSQSFQCHSPKVVQLADLNGSKLAGLITYMKRIKAGNDVDSNTRVLVFSNYKKMLNRISSVFSENGIANLFCQGNVHVRRSIIEAFQDPQEGVKKKKKPPAKVIMLSLENAASGTNLTRATHIILVDPVPGSKIGANSTEAQAIGRAHRQGGGERAFPLKVVRLLLRGTIEQDMFFRNSVETDEAE